MSYRRPFRAVLSPVRARRPAHRLRVESLEDRLAPATFTGAGPNLAINLNSANEAATFATDGITVTVNLTNGTANTLATGGNVSGNGTATATFQSSVYTGSISISDGATGTAVAFANSTGAYPQSFGISLSNAASGNISFAGSSTFNSSFSGSTTAGFVASAPASAVALAGGTSNLTLTATGHDILMQGSVVVGGTTALAGNVVQADNAANDFVGALQLTGPAVASVFDINTLTLGASNFNFGALGQTTRITATGNITQTGALTANGGGTLAISSTAGSITLSNAGNNLGASVALALSATGANTATFVNGAALLLGNESLGTGALALTGNGISQQAGTTIQAGGPVAFTVGANNKDVIAGNAGNRIAGGVSVTETTPGFLRDFSLRNAFDTAALPTGAAFTTPGDIRNLTLYFDNNGIALPAYSITGSLAVTAGGDVSQTAALTIGGNTTATILGDFAITLTNPVNALSGTVSLNAPQSTQPVQVVNATALTLGASALGRGTFAATAVTGNITSFAAIAQPKGAGAATFTVTAGNTVSLAGANDFTGGEVFAGAALTTVAVRNTDFQTNFADLTFPVTVTNLTVQFDNAGVVIPALNLTNLNVTALGITQGTGPGLTVSGTANLNAGAYPIALANPVNAISNLTLANTGRNDVTVADSKALAFAGSSTLGTGRLTVTDGVSVTEPGGATISQTAAAGPVGDVKFTSNGGNVALTGANGFIGPVSVGVVGTNTASVTNSTAPLVLGTVATGTGAFTAAAGTQNITQGPTSVLSLGGSSSFTTTGSVTLTGLSNTFTGAVGLTATNASLRGTGAVVLAASNVTGTMSVQTGGAAGPSVTQTGAITGAPIASFNAGAGDVTLATATNDFTTISVTSTGTVAVTDTNTLKVGTIRLGASPLTITTGGTLSLAAGSGGIVQTGAGAITLTTPAGSTIALGSPASLLLGPVTVTHSKNVTVQSSGDLAFAASTITGSLTATAGGALTLPPTLTTLNNLTVSAQNTTVASDITAGGTISFAGAVGFTGTRIISAGGNVSFTGDVTTGGGMTFNLPSGNTLSLNTGTWTEGANPLTFGNTSANFTIGNGAASPARFVMSTGTIAMPGSGNVTVNTNGTFQAGTDPNSAETVTIANGTGNLTIDGNLGVGFGLTNDQLIDASSGVVSLGTTAQLVGSGVAGSSASPVLTSQTALVIGRFVNSVNAAGNPTDFFAGSDIVTPAYSFTDVTVMAGGVNAPSGIATGFLPDGDAFTVKSSLTTVAGLATLVDVAGNLDVVVRNATAPTPATLTISTTGGGDGLVPVGGVAIHTPGSVSVTALAANFTGAFTAAGPLTALTARDLGTVTAPLLLTDGGSATASTALTAGVVQNSTINLAGILGSLKAVSVAAGTSLTAQSFGTLTTTGNKAAADPGDFNATLTSTSVSAGTVVKSAAVAGTLGGIWDVRGVVSTVKAFKTTGWTLGAIPAANVVNGGLLTGATSLTLGPVTTSHLNVSGPVATLTTSDVTGSTFTAGSFGSVKVAANLALGLAGTVTGSTLTATGNVAGVALKSLSIAGDLAAASALNFLNGDAPSIAVARTINASSITATDTGTLGNLKAVTAGKLASATLDARTIGTLTVKGNLPAGLFGDVTGSTVTVRNNAAGVGLATFSASGSVTGSTFDVQNGNLPKFTVGRQLGASTVKLTNPAFGALGTIQAGDWTSGVTILAKTIGTAASVGAAAVAPASPLLLGGIVTDSITAYQNTGPGPAVGKLTTKGDFSGSTLTTQHGAGTVTIGRSVLNSFLVADDAVAGDATVGNITSLTAGAWNTSAATANTLGTVKIIGYSQPESPTASFVFGDVTTGTFTAAGATPTKPTGIASFSVARHFQTGSVLHAPFGIAALTVGGSLNGSQVTTDNPGSPAAGFVTAFTTGEINNSTVRTGSIGTLKVAGSSTFGLLGSVTLSTVSADGSATTKTGPQAVGALSVAGDFTDSVLDAPATVGSVGVTGRVFANTAATGVFAGYAPSSKLGSLTAGAWGEAGSALTTDLSAQSIGTFSLKGNSGRGFVGTADGAFIDVLGNTAGVGLGTFTATGTISNSLFRVSDGDVTSFTALRLKSSDLLVGYRPVRGDDITAAATAANWSVTNHTIGSFTTTAPFNLADKADTASFVDSNVAAAILGKITLSGVNPADPPATAFGVAFRTGAGAAAKGLVKSGGATLAPPTADQQFDYLGLPG